MSLLNEALRKKSREQEPTPPRPRQFAGGGAAPRRTARTAGLTVCVLAIVGGAALLWQWLAATPPAVPPQLSTPAPAIATPAPTATALVIPATAQIPVKSPSAATPQSAPPTAKPPGATVTSPPPPSPAETLPAAINPSPVALQIQPVVTSAPVDRGPKGNPYREKALSYHQQKQYGEAAAMYQEALKSDPDHAGTLLNLAAVHIEMQAFGKAYPLLQRLTTMTPDNPAVWINLAMAETGLGRPENALAALQQAEEAGGSKFEIALHLGTAMSRVGKVDEALASYRQAETLRPDDPALIFNLALACDRAGRYTEALDYYQKLLVLEGATAPAQRQLVEQRIAVLRGYLASRKGRGNPS